MTSPNENFFRVTGPLCGEFTAYRRIPSVTRSFDVFFDLHLNKRDAGDLRRHRAHYDVTVSKALRTAKGRHRWHHSVLAKGIIFTTKTTLNVPLYILTEWNIYDNLSMVYTSGLRYTCKMEWSTAFEIWLCNGLFVLLIRMNFRLFEQFSGT